MLKILGILRKKTLNPFKNPCFLTVNAMTSVNIIISCDFFNGIRMKRGEYFQLK